MKHLVATILAFGVCGHIIAQSNLMKNIVFVKSTESGVGLVIGQEDDITYIITAFHVVKDATVVTVDSYNKAIQWQGKILAIDIIRDIACIVINSSDYVFFNEMEFPTDASFENQLENKEMFVLGKSKNKESVELLENFEFIKINNETQFMLRDINQEIYGGCSGSPVFGSDGYGNFAFWGIILRVDKNRVFCLRLIPIAFFCDENNVPTNLFIEKTTPAPQLNAPPGFTPVESGLPSGTIIPREEDLKNFMFLNKETNLYLSSDGNTIVYQLSRGGGAYQSFNLQSWGAAYLIRGNKNNCLVDKSSQNGGPVNMSSCVSSDRRQQWLLNTDKDGLIMFENVSTGRFITVSHAGEGFHKEGTSMEMWYDLRVKGHGVPNSQKWHKIPQ